MLTLDDAAKIIDPDAFHSSLPTDGCGAYWHGRRADAREKAQRIYDEFKATLPEAIDVYRTIKRNGARKHRDIAKAVAASLSMRESPDEGKPEEK